MIVKSNPDRYFNVIGSDPKGRLGEFPRKELSHKYGRASGACFDVAMGKRPYFAIFGTDHATDGMLGSNRYPDFLMVRRWNLCA